MLEPHPNQVHREHYHPGTTSSLLAAPNRLHVQGYAPMTQQYPRALMPSEIPFNAAQQQMFQPIPGTYNYAPWPQPPSLVPHKRPVWLSALVYGIPSMLCLGLLIVIGYALYYFITAGFSGMLSKFGASALGGLTDLAGSAGTAAVSLTHTTASTICGVFTAGYKSC